MASVDGEFFDFGVARLADRWIKSEIERLGAREVPDRWLGAQSYLLKGDVKAVWARWMADGLCDPSRYGPGDVYWHYKDVLDVLRDRLAHLPADEVDALVDELAPILWERIEQTHLIARRPFTQSEKNAVWDLTPDDPRCWICGLAFSEGAIQRFRRAPRPHAAIALPGFVDAYAPRGLRQQELTIQIDHVSALAVGGTFDLDNLRLACGWCNLRKSKLQMLYDARLDVEKLRLADGETRLIPPPFWVVRLLAVRRRCEHPTCTATTATHQLTVAPIWSRGAPTPPNLRVTCREHDPLVDARLVLPSRIVRRRAAVAKKAKAAA